MTLTSNRRIAVWVAVALASIFFFATSFRKGWTHAETDFPNYYTAAVLARHHAPLERFYEWPWFQRQMNYAGTERQLGGYIPQTPLTMLPMAPLSSLAPQTAKQVWLAFNVIFLAIAAALLARMTSISVGVILLLAFAGYVSLSTNFLLGQYYVFLLLLLTFGVWLLFREQAFAGGFMMGVICMLKLYSAPMFLYFAWKRQWSALFGMLAACLGLGALSVAWFGWDANVFYVTYVFRRASENAILDPYNPAVGTLANLLRRTFIAESELNPHPLLNAPFAFYLLQPFLTITVLILPLLASARNARKDLAWFLVAILLASPNTASYVFIVVLLPVAILLEDADRRSAIAIIAAYVLVCLPLRPAWSWLFPKVWLLLAMYIIAGNWRNLSLRSLTVAMAVIAVIALGLASTHHPAKGFEPVESQSRSIYSSSPALSQAGIVFESIGAEGYILNRNLAFDGYAFHPSAPRSGSPIYFELVAHGHSKIMSFHPATKDVRTEVDDAQTPTISPDGMKLAFLHDGSLFVRDHGAVARSVNDASWFPQGDHLAFSSSGVLYDSDGTKQIAKGVPGQHSEPTISPDGKWLAFTATRFGIRHIWAENLQTHAAREITDGSCNSFAPAWEMDSNGLVFASDCNRGLGLPRLFRYQVSP